MKDFYKLKEYLYYDETSITCLKWFPNKITKRGKVNPDAAGSLVAGSVSINKQWFAIKDVVWFLKNEEIPKLSEVQFKDGNIKNFKIENLYKFKGICTSDKLGDFLHEYFVYDTTSPSNLRWKMKFGKGGSNIKIGDVVGSLDKRDGYWKLHALGRHLKVHQVVWYLHYGKIEKGLHVDHINGVRDDNNIKNLRVVIPAVNFRNCSKAKNNTSGETGVTYHEGFTKKGTHYQKFYVSVTCNRVTHKASFSCNKYGHEQAFQLACQWREQKIAELNEQGAGYSERHGK